MSFEEILAHLPESDQNIIRRIAALLESLDQKTGQFSKHTKLKCKNGCGACCENPDIETTVVEVLPLAVRLWSEGRAESTLETIRRKPEGRCIFYQPDAVRGQGRCGIYAHRPGICRLFGFSARINKHGTPQLVTCKVIKEKQPEDCRRAQAQLDNGGLQAPLFGLHAQAVADIDPAGGSRLLPINQAIAQAIEKIGYALEKSKIKTGRFPLPNVTK